MTDWTKGYIGGEIPGEGFCGDLDHGSDKVVTPMDHMGLPIAGGEVGKHFAQEKYLRQGHNDIPMPGDKPGWVGRSEEQKPEKAFPDGGYRLPDEDERVSPGKIRGGGSRPF